jgi:hypothetical protein
MAWPAVADIRGEAQEPGHHSSVPRHGEGPGLGAGGAPAQLPSGGDPQCRRSNQSGRNGVRACPLFQTDIYSGPFVSKAVPKKRGPAPKIQQQLEQIETLPKAKQRVVSQMIDAMLQANARG